MTRSGLRAQVHIVFNTAVFGEVNGEDVTWSTEGRYAMCDSDLDLVCEWLDTRGKV